MALKTLMLKVRCRRNLGAAESFLISCFGDHQNWVQSNIFVRCYCIMGVMCTQADTLLKEL